MTKSRVQINRSNVSWARPVGRDPGEVYVNWADKQIGVVAPGSVAMDMVAVRFFSESAIYGTGDFVIYAGELYRATANSPAGPFVPENWTAYGPSTGTIDWSQIVNEPATFPPTLPILQSDVIGLQDELLLKADLTGALFTGPVGIDNGTDPDRPTVPANGMLSIFGDQLRFWPDLDGDGDYDADIAAKSNFYLVAGAGFDLIPGKDYAQPSLSAPGRITFRANEVANYIMSGGNYSDTWHKDLIITRRGVGAPWMIFDESRGGQVGIGTLFPTAEEIVNDIPRQLYQVGARLHVIDSTQRAALIESTGATSRLGFKDPATTTEPTIGSTANELLFRTDDISRMRIGSTGAYPSVDNAIPSGKSGQRWSAGWFNELRPGPGTALWTSGAGTPEGLVTAPVGSLYTRSDGAVSTTLYIKESGAGNTGWTAVAPGTGGGGSTAWADITGKPATFPPTVPIAQASITNLTTDLAGKAATVHTHAQADVTNLTTDLGLKAPLANPTFTGQITMPNGNAGTPGIALAGAATTGIYGTTALGFTVGGTARATLSTAVWTFTVPFKTANGTAGAPSWSWTSDGDAGFYLSAAGDMRLAMAGADVVKWLDDKSTTFSGKVLVPAPVAGGCGLNIGAAGTAPTTPVDGDIWLSGSSLQYRYGGATFTTLNIAGSQSATGQKTFTATTFFRAGTVGTPSFNFIAGGAAPTTPNNGDVWATDANGLYMRVNGVSRHLSIFVGTTAPASPITNDLWLDIN